MRRAWAVACALLLACAAPVRASVEEFASFDLSRMEEDDESALDHYLARQPEAWRREWERSTNAFRTSQGCLTAGLWNTEYEFKSRAPLGDRAHRRAAARDRCGLRCLRVPPCVPAAAQFLRGGFRRFLFGYH